MDGRMGGGSTADDAVVGFCAFLSHQVLMQL